MISRIIHTFDQQWPVMTSTIHYQSVLDILQVSIADHLVVTFLRVQSLIMFTTVSKGVRTSLCDLVLSKDHSIAGHSSVCSLSFLAWCPETHMNSIWWWFSSIRYNILYCYFNDSYYRLYLDFIEEKANHYYLMSRNSYLFQLMIVNEYIQSLNSSFRPEKTIDAVGIKVIAFIAF